VAQISILEAIRVPLDKDEGVVKAYYTAAVRKHRLSFQREVEDQGSGRFTLHPFSVDRSSFDAPPTIDTAISNGP
jgi:hypothetical protein